MHLRAGELGGFETNFASPRQYAHCATEVQRQYLPIEIADFADGSEGGDKAMEEPKSDGYFDVRREIVSN